MGMKTTVEIADALLREAKQEARAKGITLRDLIELGLRRELDARRQVRRPFTLRDASYKGPSGLVPGLRYEDGRALRAYANMRDEDSLDDIHAELDARTEDRQ
jgi:hypothetical protein